MSLETTNRWNTTIARKFVEHLSNVGRSGNGLEIDEFPFGSVLQTGRFDLQGLVLPARTELRRINFKSVDFTGAILKQLWFESCLFFEATFDRVALNGLSDINNTFRRCSFDRSNFRKAKIGYRGSRFNECHFMRCDFLQAGFIRPEFDNCVFEDCAFSGIDFKAASFENCQFSGEVRGVWFRGKYQLSPVIEQFPASRPNTMHSVSFKKAILIDVTFSDYCNLSSVIPPDDGRHFLFNDWPKSIDNVYRQSVSWPDPFRKQAENFYKSYQSQAQTQQWYILGEEALFNRYGREVGSKIWWALLSGSDQKRIVL